MSDILTPSDLEKIEQRAAKASAGPWTIELWNIGHRDWNVDAPGARDIATLNGSDGHDEPTEYPSEENAAFIAHARTDIPSLIASHRKLQEELERARAMLKPFADFAESLELDRCAVRSPSQGLDGPFNDDDQIAVAGNSSGYTTLRCHHFRKARAATQGAEHV